MTQVYYLKPDLDMHAAYVQQGCGSAEPRTGVFIRIHMLEQGTFQDLEAACLAAFGQRHSARR